MSGLGDLVARRPRALIIVGYSERDEVVVQKVIGPLADRWRVYRISPNATGEGAIRLPAQEALEVLANDLTSDPEFRGWAFVSFDNQRGIEAAVLGERLDQRDVGVCPRLPHFDAAAQRLDLLHTVEIAGHPGCGKSLTAWQLAAEYNRRGWTVLKPSATLHDGRRSEVVGPSPWPRVLVIDDAQTHPVALLDEFRSVASPNLKVLLASTDREGERTSSVRIPAKAAVEVLAAEFRRRAEILTLVRRLDPHVGDGYGDTSLETRIREAEAQDSPWQFAFVLRGGWRQACEQLQSLRDFDRADLLLVLVAHRQLLSLDAGCSVEEVYRDAKAINRSETWVRQSLSVLRSRRTILETDPLRCAHVRAAKLVVGSFFENRKEPEFRRLLALVRTNIHSISTPLRGISWLISELFSHPAYLSSTNPEWGLLPPEDANRLVQRCFAVTTSHDRRDAAFVLERLLGYRTRTRADLSQWEQILPQWVASADGYNAYAIGGLVNNIFNEDKPTAARLIDRTDPVQVSKRLNSIRCADGYGWGHYLGRVSVAASEEWRERFSQGLPREHLLNLAGQFTSKDLGDLSELLHGVAAFNFEFATDCLRRAIPALRTGFRDDPLVALAETLDVRWILLGEHPFGHSRPNREQRKLSKEIISAIEPFRVANEIVACRYGDWEKYAELLRWMKKTNPVQHHATVAALNWEQLHARIGEMWSKPPRELRLLLSSLVTDGVGQPVRDWLASRATSIKVIDPILSGLAPEAAVSVVRSGGSINLGGHNGSDWELQAWAVSRIAALDLEVATQALEAQIPRMAGMLSKFELNSVFGLTVLLDQIRSLVPTMLTKLLQLVDQKTAEASWPEQYAQCRGENRRSANKLLRFLKDHADEKLRQLAVNLSRKRSAK